MKRDMKNIIIYSLIGLAGIGLINLLLTDTFGLIRSLLITLVIGAVIFGVLYFFLIRRRGAPTDELKKYRKAAKQSKQRYKQANPSPIKYSSSSQKKPSRAKRLNRKKASHLTVIEGNKDKKKNRASL
ncbi:SA1362 family protein [Gracilibacillus alcaliphilus]|uniref:SA1362 family protein n=1 Tax=Gracilibacillus alcaliphilus TaxID=1401441 RepID=UPI00195E6C71|nr:SA1362 family protein [Gracilibacillus alcaliphilus]MBM7675048.1 putative lipid-binding transport protein (Tim44 family) [Gracilibacillus alcaliphilus]